MLGRGQRRHLTLRLARAKLPKDLGDGTSLDSAVEQLVNFDGASREPNDGFPVLQTISGGLEIHRHQAPRDRLELRDLVL